MNEFRRYAIYYAAPKGDLADFAASWLGWDPVAGAQVAHPNIANLPLPVADITATPRKYGFHGTIKPPFFLADSRSVEELANAMGSLAERLSPASLEGLQLSAIGRFLALTIVGDQTPLADLAAAVVKELDGFRKPPSEAELTRRRAGGLSARQEELLQAWGYPYVMDQFKFHLTLSGKLSKSEVTATRNALSPLLEPILPKPFTISELCLFGEAEDGMFHVIHRYGLSG